MRKLLILMLPVTLLACATVEPPPANVAGTICWKELPTGSNLPVTRCSTEEERQRQKEQVDAISNEIQRSTPNKARGSGGV